MQLSKVLYNHFNIFLCHFIHYIYIRILCTNNINYTKHHLAIFFKLLSKGSNPYIKWKIDTQISLIAETIDIQFAINYNRYNA
jgi:L-cystine uptake protein TcyP (sodium:dicarboxylate symporter family)